MSPEETKPSVPDQGVMGTLLIPVWARARETLRRDGLVRDPYAVRILAEDGRELAALSTHWMVQTGIAVRTWLLDRMVARHLADHPAGPIVNLGCGLDARCYRLDNGRARWIDIDLNPVIAARRRFFEASPRHDMRACSVTDHGWMDTVPADTPPLFIAEGVLMYLKPAEVEALIRAMAARFPGAIFLFELTARARIAASRKNHVVKAFSAAFEWGCDDPGEIAAWAPGTTVTHNDFYLHAFPRRWKWLTLLRLLPAARRSTRIVGLRFGPA